MKWSKDYATGIEQIDRDHQMIFRMSEDFPDTRVIVISGVGNVIPMKHEPSARKASDNLATTTGVDVTMAKPFDRREILDAVKELVAS